MIVNLSQPTHRSFKSLTGQELSTAMETREGEAESLHDMVVRSETKLKVSRDAYEPLRQTRDSLDRDVSQLFKEVNKKAHTHNILRAVRKITPFTGMGGIPIGMAIGLTINPAATLAGFVVAVGSMALHEFSMRYCRKMTRDHEQIKANYEDAAEKLGKLKQQCESIEKDLQVMEKECRDLRDRETKATAEVKAMAEKLASSVPSGASDVDESGGYLIIDGVKIRKQAA